METRELVSNSNGIFMSDEYNPADGGFAGTIELSKSGKFGKTDMYHNVGYGRMERRIDVFRVVGSQVYFLTSVTF